MLNEIVRGNDSVTGDANKIFDKYLLELNKELSYVHFKLRACRDQYDGHVCYGVVNIVSNDQSKLGTKYFVPQIAFFKGIIEAIAQDEAAQGCISGFDALNICLENQDGDAISATRAG
ncbi:embryo defective 1379 [Raphanus sativus]|nr:embryo defective 1379 [Raphanus sativus]